MERSVVFAGFGGQGVLLAGKVLARAAMDLGLHVTWLPSYGPEMRGGTANCTVVVSTDPVGSPIVDAPDVLLAMNGPSLDKFEGRVTPGGVIVVNSSLVPRAVTRKDVREVRLAANDLARELGEPRAANMAALGAIVWAIGTVPLEAVKAAMRGELGAKIGEKAAHANEAALEQGFALGQKTNLGT